MSQQTRDILAAFDANLPLERARTIPSAWYVNPCVYDQERRAVFGDSWLVAGLMDDVSEPGSFLTTEIAGEPILVVRDNEEVLRAFYNVCRHRAAPLCTQHTGKTTRLRCRYHGWTYDLAGRLR